MICENCGAEIMSMLDQATHPCPKSSEEQVFKPLTATDLDEIFKQFYEAED